MTIQQALHDFLAFFNTEVGYIVLFVLIIIFTILAVRWFKRFFHKRILEAVFTSKDPTNYLFFQHILTASIYIAGFGTAFYMIPSLRTLSASLLAGAGIFAVAIGFASQKAFANIISGLFVVIFKPFRINDRVAIGKDISGVVEDITLRHTVVRSYENKRFVIPNALISEQVIVNSDLTDEEINKFIFFKVSYNADLAKAKSIIRELAEAHPKVLDRRTPEEVEEGKNKATVLVTEWGDYGAIIRLAVWTANAADAFSVTCALNETVKAAFDEEGIGVPTGVRLV
jgi:small conductance mechanosensitive channel